MNKQQFIFLMCSFHDLAYLRGLFIWRKIMKRKVIIDCDPGIDDSLAIMLALSCEEIDVIALTIVAGNSPIELGFENAKRVLSHMNRLDIPIYIGKDKPLKKDFINALDTHGKDGLGESFLPSIEGYHQDQSAITCLKENKDYDLLALGPLTNIASWIQEDPDALKNVNTIVSMGGTFKSHGNCSPVAEYNYWEDPEAAKIVYEHCTKLNKIIHMVGLDVTRKIVLTPNLIEYIKRLDHYHGDFIQRITKFYMDFHWEWEHIIGCVINDPLALAYLVDPSLCSGFDAYTDIETDGISRGQSVVDEYNFYNKKANAHILTNVDPHRFFHFFFSKLIDKKPGLLEILL